MSQQGVIFDQHLTDSLFRLVQGSSYRSRGAWTPTLRPLPPADALSTLLLFGKAFLPLPLWRRISVDDAFRRLTEEDLVQWIPSAAYDQAAVELTRVGKIWHRVSQLNSLVNMESGIRNQFSSRVIPGLSGFVTMPPSVREQKSAYSRRYWKLLELEEELVGFSVPFLYSPWPLARANIAHIRAPRDPVDFFRRGPQLDIHYMLIIPPDELGLEGLYHEQALRNIPKDATLLPYSLYPQLYSMLAFDREKGSDLINYAQQKDAINLAIAALTTRASAIFAVESGIPLATKQYADEKIGLEAVGPEEQQLVRFQFQALRYPVIETFDDLLRLREDPHLPAYRAIIWHYASELRESLVSERFKVLESFRNELDLALRSLKGTQKWSRVTDVAFWISIPLAVVGAVCGLPLSDIVAIPVTGAAKYVTNRALKNHRWILFGK